MAKSVEPGSTAEVEISRYGNLPKPLKLLFLFFTFVALGVVVFYIFGFTFRGGLIMDMEYYYLLIALFLPCVFLIQPATKKEKGIPWYDLVLAALALGVSFYFFWNGYSIRHIGESWLPPNTLNFSLGLILVLLVLEGGRRLGGNIFLVVCIIFGAYPLYAQYMPGILFGRSFSFPMTIGFIAFGNEGIVGLPTRVLGEILIGFYIFAGFMIASGAGRFFLRLAMCLLGTVRGGPAKVAVVSSGFFGSLSGSAFANIVATGSFTIPAMKRMGYPNHYAGAIEACASTGGMLMPPVMGASAFIMAVVLGVDYGTVIIAAAIPAILYYFGLLMQVDAYAARVGLKGLPREELPSVRQTFKAGWPFIAVLAFLVWGLLYMRWAALTPFYASVLMIVLSYTSKETRLTPRRLLDAFVVVGRLCTQGTALLLPIGIIIAGLIVSGVAHSFTAGIMMLGGGNVILILLIGVVVCYLLGMAGLIVPAYIFLAITLAPAVIKIAGLNEMAVHLFIIYYSMMAVITLPVAAGAFLAAALAGASPMKTAWTAMRLGIVIYFIPFFFIFNPALILQGSPIETLYLFVLCIIGISFIAGGMEGYLVKVGRLVFWERPFYVIAGVLIAFPQWMPTFIGAAIAVVLIAITMLRMKRGLKQPEQLVPS